MEQSQKEALMQSLHRLKKVHTWFTMPPEISRGEFFMLHKISHLSRDASPEKPGAKITDLSVAAEMSKPAVSQMLNSLEDKNMIERVTTKSDRRVVFVRLTEQGQKQLKATIESLNRLMEQVVDELGPEDTAELTRLFEKLHGIIERMDKK